MKTYLILQLLTLFVILGCSKSDYLTHKDNSISESSIVSYKESDGMRYTYSLVQDPNAQLPKKICCGIGNECRKEECVGLAFTQYEWDTYFQGYTYNQLLTLDLSDSAHADYVQYLQSTGFGM